MEKCFAAKSEYFEKKLNLYFTKVYRVSHYEKVSIDSYKLMKIAIYSVIIWKYTVVKFNNVLKFRRNS